MHGDDTDLRIQEYRSWSRREYHYDDFQSESEDEDTDETDTEEDD